MAGENTYHESDGKGIAVTLASSLSAGQVAYVEGWLGIMTENGDSGKTRGMTIDDREYQWSVPDGLAVSKGDTVYVDITDLTGHKPNDTAYNTVGGANNLALFKATADKDTSGGAGNHFVTGRSLLHTQGG